MGLEGLGNLRFSSQRCLIANPQIKEIALTRSHRHNSLHLYSSPSSTAPKALSVAFLASVKPVIPVMFILS